MKLVDGPLGSSAGSAEPITLAAQLTVEEALEVDSRDALDRDCCARGFEPGQCYRDSYRQAPGGGRDPNSSVRDRPDALYSRIICVAESNGAHEQSAIR